MIDFLKKFLGFWVLTAVGVAVGPSAGLQADDRGAENSAIKAVIERYSENHIFEGAVLVARGGDILYMGGEGLANREWNMPNGPKVKYRLASLTKGFTAALILKLAEEGRLSLDDVIHDHLPEYQGPATEVITVEQLLRHTSGMQHTVGLPGWFTGQFRRDISDAEYLSEMAKLPLQSEPGERYGYSNLGYFLLGKIAEKVTGETYAEALNERIFRPLGMEDTGVETAAAILPKRADGYVWAKNGGFRNQGYVNMDVFGAGAAIYSTALDMFKWQQGLMGGKILSADNMAKMFEPGDAIGWRAEDWTLPSGEVVATINYDGQIDGFTSYLTHFKERGVTIILLGNIGTGASTKAQMTADILMGLEGRQIGKLPLSYYLTKALVDGSLDLGIEGYRAAPDRFDVEEGRLEAFGNELGWAQMPQKSLAVRLLVADMFPESVRAFVMLARTQTNLGQCTAATDTYERALGLLPEGEEAELRDYLKSQIAGLKCE